MYGNSHIDDLRLICDHLLPSDVALHVLPFFPSDGDGGFAPSDPFSVDEEYGNWRDVYSLASDRRLILDGVFNHVGINHPWVQGAQRDPKEYNELLHIYGDIIDGSQHPSPRGGSAVKTYVLGSERWSFWQTFSEAAVDVRLESREVRDWIRRQLSFYRTVGTWGIRLDAAAYYGKVPGEPQFHHPLARSYATDIAREAKDVGLFVMAQLDCDDRGQKYFKEGDVSQTPIMDYAYTAYLILALLTGDPCPLADHLQRTLPIAHRLVRTPRNHDGILLRPRLLLHEHKERLIAAAHRLGVPVRVNNGSPYEINSSLPGLLAKLGNEEEFWQRLSLCIVVTACLPGVAYYYLPNLVGDVPEDRSTSNQPDPRSTNRMPLPEGTWTDFLKGPQATKTKDQLRMLATIFHDSENRVTKREGIAQLTMEIRVVDGVLIVGRRDLRLSVAVNFSNSHAVTVPDVTAGSFCFGQMPVDGQLDPLQFVCWESGPSVDL